MIFFFLFPSSLVFAKEGNSEKACAPMMTEENKNMVETFKKEDASLQESYAIDLVEAFWNMFNLNTLDTLIFGNPYCLWFDDEPELVYGVFPKEQKELIIDPIFATFTGTFVVALTISIMFFSLKMAYSPLGGNKTRLMEELYMYIATGILIVGYWLLAEKIIELNWSIVSTFRTLLENAGINLNGFSIVANQDDFNFSDIIIMFAEWLLTLFLNFVYILRTFMMIILMGLGGLAIISLLFASTRSYFVTWLQDLCGSIFMQSIHAIYMTIVLLLVNLVEGEFSVVIKLVLLILFLPLSSMIMNWIGLSSGGLATSIGLQGVNSIATAVRVAGMMNSRMPKKQKSNTLGNLQSTRISANAKGNYSDTWTSAKNIMGKTGMLVGAAAGSVLGPGGVLLGARMGSMGAQSLMQVPRNIGSGVHSAVSTIKDAKADGFKNVMGNLQSRRAFFGNLGESAGVMFGSGNAGRNVGHALSGVSRQRLMNSSENGGYSGMTLGQIASQNPEAKIAWMQTNQGSAMYMDDNGTLKRISPLGEADPSLKNGENRMIDYEFQKTGFVANDSGSYQFQTGSQGLHRTSEAYITDATGQTYQDSRVNASTISPDSYYEHSLRGADTRNISDRFADYIAKEPRHQGFV